MLKITVTVLLVALAGTASAAGWRSMRIDGSSEATFEASVTALQQKLPQVRRRVLDLALRDIWAEGAKAAAAREREYSMSEYLGQLDGLGYKEVVTFTDPTGKTAERRSRQIYAQLYRPSRPIIAPGRSEASSYRSLDGVNQRGGVAQMEQNNAWYSR